MIFKADIQAVLTDTMPIVAVEIDTGKIEFVTRALERLFGYDAILDELVGMQIEVLVPESLRDVHIAHRESLALQPIKARQMAAMALKVEGRRRDGTVFPVQVLLYPAKLSGILCVVGVVLDRST